VIGRRFLASRWYPILAAILLATPVLSSAQARDDDSVFYFFYSDSCSHCQEARPFIRKLTVHYPQIIFREYDISKSAESLDLFLKKSAELSIAKPGLPTFILGRTSVVGFTKGVYDKQLEDLIENRLGRSRAPGKLDVGLVRLPVLGSIDSSLASLPSFTIVIGLLEGLNPRALWPLMLLLMPLAEAGSRKRLIMIGSAFVLASAFFYFLLMTAWLNVFLFLGVTAYASVALGLAAIALGLFATKESFQKKGLGYEKRLILMTPSGAMPKLFEMRRKIMEQGDAWLAVVGTIALALFANLSELGSTVGLPAIYARVLSIQALDAWPMYLNMTLCTVCYAIPPSAIITLSAATMGKRGIQGRSAKTLGLISGLSTMTLGLILVLLPDLLIF
jgi:hypothetical protein